MAKGGGSRRSRGGRERAKKGGKSAFLIPPHSFSRKELTKRRKKSSKIEELVYELGWGTSITKLSQKEGVMRGKTMKTIALITEDAALGPERTY